MFFTKLLPRVSNKDVDGRTVKMSEHDHIFSVLVQKGYGVRR